MANISDNNKRIAKNTLLLYGRMAIMLVVGLFTSRVVLAALGIRDYGIYNVVWRCRCPFLSSYRSHECDDQ